MAFPLPFLSDLHPNFLGQVPFLARPDSSSLSSDITVKSGLISAQTQTVFGHHHHSSPQVTISPQARIAFLSATAFIILAVLLVKRLWTNRDPFFVPKGKSTDVVVNVNDFLFLYPKALLPSGVPVEKLSGQRLTWAYITMGGLIGMAVANGWQLGRRISEGMNFREDAAELGFFSFIAFLYFLRFLRTPYRQTIYYSTYIATFLYTILLFQRDIWPKILLHPSNDILYVARQGLILDLRVVFSAIILVAFLSTPRVWYPVDPYDGNVRASAEQLASFFSYVLSYYWIESLVHRAFRHNIEPSDLPTLPDYDRAKLWASKSEQRRKKTTFRTIVSLLKADFFIMSLCSLVYGLTQFIAPLSMKGILAYLENKEAAALSPWLWVWGLFIGPLINSWIFQAYIFNSTRLIIRVRAALTQSLLIKTLKMRFGADSEKKETDPKKEAEKEVGQRGHKVGMINNLMSSDIEALVGVRDIVLVLGSSLMEVIFSVYFLYQLLDWAAFVGIALNLVMMPVPIFLAYFLASIQKKVKKATDERIGIVQEVLNAVRVIKYFGWEQATIKRIQVKRDAEVWLSLKSSMMNIGFYLVGLILPLTNMLVTFAIFTTVMKRDLTSSVAFTSIALFEMLRNQFAFVGYIVSESVNAGVSFGRIDKFLNEEPELDEARTAKRMAEVEVYADVTPDGPPSYKNAILSWNPPDSENDNGFRLRLTVECVDKGLTMVLGPVGSGKTAFLLGLLDEMLILQGDVHLSRKGGVALVSQTAWLQQASIKDNILFGSQNYSEERYKEVLEVCGLAQDLDQFEHGDATEVGERGITLSGGQKARLSLARAVYSSAKTLLLDDPLSALDAGTSKWVFEKCIKGKILKDRTVILVTHQASLAPQADKVIVLDDGAIVSAGAPESVESAVKDALSKDEVAQKLQEEEEEEAGAENQVDDVLEDNTNATKKPSGPVAKLVVEEERAIGRVPVKLIWQYVSTFGGPLFLTVLFVMTILEGFAPLASSLVLGLWTNAYNEPGEVDVKFWLLMYGVVVLGTTVFSLSSFTAWYVAQWWAGRKAHDKLLHSVLFSPVRFFDTTPIGRIINRFSKDIKSMDRALGIFFKITFSQLLDNIFRIIVLSGLIPIFIIPAVIVAIVGYLIGEMYLRAQMAVKRIVSVKESPLFSHFNDTIQGILTIRAFSVEKRFINESLVKVDDYSQANEALYNLNRWLGVRVEGASSVIGFAAGYLSLVSGLSPGLVGFSLTNSLAFCTSILMTVRHYNTLEVELNSFERVDEYIRLKQEPPSTEDGTPPASWPATGEVEIKDLSVKYTPEGPDVLHKLNFTVKSGERIGVVGRTGAGKSSLALSLLRFTEISNGSVTISGRNILETNLTDLRQRVTLIPQDPVMMSGTVRSNLDPFEEKDDTDLVDALIRSGLSDCVVEEGGPSDSGIGSSQNNSGRSSPIPSGSGSGTATPKSKTKKITLDTKITAGGENLSQGQRQLLAFARALVRRSKLVILDEATSSTDSETDDRIQEAIKTAFHGSSVITIAHRLKTVASLDRVLVLDNKGNGGEVVEYDTPYNLLKKKDSLLYNLAKKSGEFGKLYGMAAAVAGESSTTTATTTTTTNSSAEASRTVSLRGVKRD